MATNNMSTLIIRPHQIDTLPTLDPTTKARYKSALTQLWSQLAQHAQGTPARAEAENKIRQASQQIMQAINAGSRPGGAAGQQRQGGQQQGAAGAQAPGAGGQQQANPQAAQMQAQNSGQMQNAQTAQPQQSAQQVAQSGQPGQPGAVPASQLLTTAQEAKLKADVQAMTVYPPANLPVEQHATYTLNWKSQVFGCLKGRDTCAAQGKQLQQQMAALKAKGQQQIPADFETKLKDLKQKHDGFIKRLAALQQNNLANRPGAQQPTQATAQAQQAPVQAQAQPSIQQQQQQPAQQQAQTAPKPQTQQVQPPQQPSTNPNAQPTNMQRQSTQQGTPTPANNQQRPPPDTKAVINPNNLATTQSGAAQGVQPGQVQTPNGMQNGQLPQRNPVPPVGQGQPPQSFTGNNAQQMQQQQQRPPMNAQQAQNMRQQQQQQQPANQTPTSAIPTSAVQQQPQQQPLHQQPQALTHQAAISQSQAQAQAAQQAANGTPNGMPFAGAGPAQNTPTSAHPFPGMSSASHANPGIQFKATTTKTLVLDPRVQVPAPGPPSRPTLANQGMLQQPSVQRAPPYVLEGEGDHVLSKRKLDELVRQVTGAVAPDAAAASGGGTSLLDPDVEESILEVADEFVDNVITAACRLAKLRPTQTLDIRDVQIVLERNYGIRIPGYSLDEVRTVRKFQPAPGWQSKMQAIQAGKVMGSRET